MAKLTNAGYCTVGFKNTVSGMKYTYILFSLTTLDAAQKAIQLTKYPYNPLADPTDIYIHPT